MEKLRYEVNGKEIEEYFNKLTSLLNVYLNESIEERIDAIITRFEADRREGICSYDKNDLFSFWHSKLLDSKRFMVIFAIIYVRGPQGPGMRTSSMP